MSHPYNLLLIQALVCLLLSHLFADAAIVPSKVSTLSDVPPYFHQASFNSSALFNGTTKCVLPLEPLDPISLEQCQPLFHWVLTSPDAEISFLYRHVAKPIVIANGNGCVIWLDSRVRPADIAISKRIIVDYARQVLLLCSHLGQGGWTQIDGNEDWIVIVSGRLLANKATISGDGLSLEMQEQ